jgi:hypothetical protein
MMSKDDRELIERLKKSAETSSRISREMAEAKSLRQGDCNPPRADLYAWTKPEDTLEGQAAARLEALQAQPVGEERVAWRTDMENAPRDGSVFQLTDGKDVYAVAWNPALKGSGWPWVLFEGVVNYSPTGCCEREDGERIDVNGWMEHAPTAWRPLAALTASPPVVEREATSDVVDRARQIAQESYDAIRPTGGKFWGELDDMTQTLAIVAARDAILALTPVEGAGEREARTEYGWLIERDGHGGLRYATPRSWTADHMQALRFARKVDAEEFAASRQDWSTDIRITEHAWD